MLSTIYRGDLHLIKIAERLGDCAGFPVTIFEHEGMICFPRYDGVTLKDGFSFRLFIPGRAETVLCEFEYSMSNSDRALSDAISRFVIEGIECLKDQARASFERAIALMAEEATHA